MRKLETKEEYEKGERSEWRKRKIENSMGCEVAAVHCVLSLHFDLTITTFTT